MTIDISKPLMNRLGWPVRVFPTAVYAGVDPPRMAVAVYQPTNREQVGDRALDGHVWGPDEDSPYDFINEVNETVTPDMLVNGQHFLVKHDGCRYIALFYDGRFIVQYIKIEDRFYIDGTPEELAAKCIRRVEVP